jgi:hypothetical protein
MNVVEINSLSTFSPGIWRSENSETHWQSTATSGAQVDATRLSQFSPATPEFTLSIEVPTFGAKLTSEIVHLDSSDNYDEITFKSVVDVGVTALFTIRSQPATKPDENLQIKEASLSFQVTEHRPRPLFITDTLYSMLGLGGPVRVLIPSLSLDISLQFNVALSELSDLLQRRKMYFGLLVIEKATKQQFSVPEFISGEDMSAIFFTARAILDRKFVWRVNEIVLPLPANDESFQWFRSLKPSAPDTSTFKMMFGPTTTHRMVLGQQISLGPQTVLLEDALIEDQNRVASALTTKNGRIVSVRIRPISHLGTYIFSDVPTLPDNAWDQNIRHFIEIDNALSQGLVSRYLALMSAVVPELPPEQMYALLNPETIALLAEQARDHRTAVDQYLLSLLNNVQRPTSSTYGSETQFDADMAAFAEGTDTLPPYTGSYSRSEIYFDHD